MEFDRSYPVSVKIPTNVDTIVFTHVADTERHILRKNLGAEFDGTIPGLGEIQTHDDTLFCKKRVADTERHILDYFSWS